MGSESYSRAAYSRISEDRSTKTVTENFTQHKTRKIHPDLDPHKLVIRESRDSEANPTSVPIIVGLDVTGSMQSIPEKLITGKLGKLMETVIDNGTPYPHIMFLAIGDHISDSAPLQISQFEASAEKIDEELGKIYIEGGGGGGGHESYSLAWYVAAYLTSIDSYEKRGKKGFLFTIGDEAYHKTLEAHFLKEKIGYEGQDLNSDDLFQEASRTYHVFHIHLTEGFNGGSDYPKNMFSKIMGQNFIELTDKEKVAEVIATTVALVNGIDLAEATAAFDSSTKAIVSTALARVSSSIQTTNGPSSGVISL